MPHRYPVRRRFAGASLPLFRLLLITLTLASAIAVSLFGGRAQATGVTARLLTARAPLPTLQGAEALAYLRQTGSFDALQLALAKLPSAAPSAKAAKPSDKGQASVTGGDCNNWVFAKEIAAMDLALTDKFGWEVAISGDLIVVGAHDADVGGNNAQGAAYIFERNAGGADNWGEVKKLTASDGATNDNFGTVSISGDIVVVGALSANFGFGAAYIFERNAGGADNWGEVKKLTASDGAFADLFGIDTAVSGDTVIIGASGVNFAEGAAYIFERNAGGANNWGEVKKLTAADGAADDRFGNSVAISGDTVVAGAYRADVGGNNAQGAAYIFERNAGGANNWGEVKKLAAADGAADDAYGFGVSINSDTIVVGAPSGNTNQGAAYLYERNQGGANNWGESKRLVATEGVVSRSFGLAVSISGDIIVSTSPADSVGDNEQQGSAYVFGRNQGGANNWGLLNHLTASNGEPLDRFGGAAGVSGETLIVGTAADDTGKIINPSSVYIYNCVFVPPPPNTPPGIVAVESAGVVAGTMADEPVGSVSDGEDPLTSLVVTVSSDGMTFLPSATLNGVTVSNLRVVSKGLVIATLAATCAATDATFTLQVTDPGGLTATATLLVTVAPDTQPPTLPSPANITVPTAAKQCAAVVSYATPVAEDNCSTPTVVCSPPSGTTFGKGTTTVTCTATDAAKNVAQASFLVTVNDTEPPTIVCPANLIGIAPTPGQGSVIVTYPPPTANDNCPDVTVVCAPASGSLFPLGATTVTCTATDAANNTAQCAFTVSVFDVCLQDDAVAGRALLFNSLTGDYLFRCDGSSWTGKGIVTRRGSDITLQHNVVDRRVSGQVTLSTHRGTASLQTPPGKAVCAINDRDIRNNNCGA